MKKSNYNFFYKIDDGILAYNARTNAMATIDPSDISIVKNILNGLDCEDNELKDQLVYGGFIIENDVDELSIIRHDLFVNRFANNSLSLIIAPTSDCNFRCPYCYEKDVLHQNKMSDKVAEDIVAFVKQRADGISNLSIVWYGGEPLLEFERITDLSKKFIEICEEHRVIYDSSIITNGYLLTKERLSKLIDCRISSVQVTVDGVKETHDNRRYLKNHGATFERIMENLLSFQTIANNMEGFPSIGLRINVDRENINEAFELLEYISTSPLNQYVKPYVAGVYDPKDIEHKKTLTDMEYVELKYKFIPKCEEKGFKIDYNAYYPRHTLANCNCDRIDSFVVDANGDLYKCWEEIGDKSTCVGQIKTELNNNLPNRYYKYLLYDPTTDEQCMNCKILPVCMGGGCPLRRERDHRRNCQFELDSFELSIHKSAQKLGVQVLEQIDLN